LYILRSVDIDDLDDLFELSGKVLFLNLPHNKKVIEEKIKRSLTCFQNPGPDLSNNYYFFVLEDIEKKKVIGVSMIHAQHGTEKEPHFFLRVSSENKYSQSINTGFVHGTLKLGLDTNGPTEIGGLVVDPAYRGNPNKLGKQISFVRFLYMAVNPERFKSVIHSELMPPFDKDGNSPLWEAIGRRFMNMNYDEADKLSRNNKEFILSLFPSDNIYMSLLSPTARNAVGKVGDDTLPVKKMLESIGFEYMMEVDPFDGGPHYRCDLDKISLVRNKMVGKIGEFQFDENNSLPVLLSFKHKKFPFFTIQTIVCFNSEKSEFSLPSEIMRKYNLCVGTELFAIRF
jgi:arginine N-succinyltransferase